jgi:dTDP-4-amino-4,6-dideoxygalactose transaminase
VTRRVPLVDLAVQHAEVASAVRAGWDRVLERGAFVLGEEVAAFERDFARFCGIAHCVGVANGTDALELALRAIGIGHGDEVIVPANSFVASAVAVVRAGGTPRFVDVCPDTHLIDPEAAAAAVTARTFAVMPVHLYGQVASMAELQELAGGTGIRIVEDMAQAQGACQRGVLAGSFGLVAATSFYPGKNIGAYGDAGAVVTDNAEIALHVERLRNYGGVAKYEHAELGFNSRMDTLQAVVLSAKLERLAGWNDLRRVAAARYDEMLRDIEGLELPTVATGNDHVWHLYVVRVADRDNVLQHLHDAGVAAGIHYPEPLHLLEPFSHLGGRVGDFPVAERLAGRVLSLPLYPGITEDDQQFVAGELAKAMR